MATVLGYAVVVAAGCLAALVVCGVIALKKGWDR